MELRGKECTLLDYLRKRRGTDTSDCDEQFEGLRRRVNREYQKILGHGMLYQRLRIPSDGHPCSTITFCLISPDKRIIFAKLDASSSRPARWRKNKSLRDIYNFLRRNFADEMNKYNVEMYRISEKKGGIEKYLVCGNENYKNTI